MGINRLNDNLNKEELYKARKDRINEFSKLLKGDNNLREEFYEDIESVEMVMRFEVILSAPHTNLSLKDGLYIYMNEEGNIINAEYYIKKDNDINIINLENEELNMVIDLFKDVFALDVQ